MPEIKKRLNIAIPMELYTKVTEKYGITEAIVEGLNLLLEPKKPEHDITQSNTLQSRINELQEQVTDKNRQNEIRVKELQSYNEILVKEYQVQIQELYAQLHTKDAQIEKINENMQAQAIHLQTLLNQKAIEAPGAKKPWWRFW